MKLSGIDKIVWALSFYGNMALLAVLLIRGRWRQFPIFTGFIAFDVTRSIALYVLYSHGSMAWYAHVYWWALIPDFALQMGVVLELSRIVLRPTGTWVQDARFQFWAVAAVGMVVAALLAWWVSPPARSVLAAWRIRGNLFTSLVISEMFVAMALTANRLGLGWRSHVMAIGQGLTAWSSVMVVTTALQSYVGSGFFFRELDQIRAFAYVAAITWMMVWLWLPEPERQPLARELEEYILALHQRVAYDLQRIDAGS
jgi:hypothetical protein